MNARSRINLLFLSFSLSRRFALCPWSFRSRTRERDSLVRAKMMTRVWLFREGGTRTERADLEKMHVFARERRSFAGGGGVWVVVDSAR